MKRKPYSIKIILLLTCLVLPFTLNSCEKIDEFNETFKDLVATFEAQSEEWQELIARESEVWRDLANVNSQQWQDVLQGESQAWQDLIADKSDEWIVVADSMVTIIRDFQETADYFVNTLNDINDDMPIHIQLAIADLNKAINNAIGTLTSNFLCASDILEGKALNWVEFVKTELGIRSDNTSYQPQDILNEPSICSSDINTIDLSLPQNRWDEITIFGYGFDDSYQDIEVVFSNGLGLQYAPGGQLLFKNSNYQLVLILSFMDESQIRLYDKVSLLYKGDDLLTEFPIKK